MSERKKVRGREVTPRRGKFSCWETIQGLVDQFKEVGLNLKSNRKMLKNAKQSEDMFI